MHTYTVTHAQAHTERHARWLFIKLHCQICQALNLGDAGRVSGARRAAQEARKAGGTQTNQEETK